MGEKSGWGDLPIELWPKIAKCLHNRVDLLRFRSVCNSWRSSIPPSHPNSPSFPLQIPYPFNPSIDACLNQAICYHVQPLDGSSTKFEPSSSSSSSSSKGWLIKVKESKNLPMRLLNPVSDRKILYPLNTSPMLWNLLDHRVLELCKSYTFQNTGRQRRFDYFKKVVFFPSSPWTDAGDSVACCIYSKGILAILKHGDKQWKLVDDKNFDYDDVIVYKGQFYVADKWGTISWVDISCSKVVQYSPPLYGFGSKKHLVESCGSLYVVDRYNDDEPIRRNYVERTDHDQDAAVEYFKVYKLDEEWGTWVDVKSLGDRVFILGNSCSFSVSAKEVTGYQGNHVYYTDTFNVYKYNLDNHGVVTVDLDPRCANLFGHPHVG